MNLIIITYGIIEVLKLSDICDCISRNPDRNLKLENLCNIEVLVLEDFFLCEFEKQNKTKQKKTKQSNNQKTTLSTNDCNLETSNDNNLHRKNRSSQIVTDLG